VRRVMLGRKAQEAPAVEGVQEVKGGVKAYAHT